MADRSELPIYLHRVGLDYALDHCRGHPALP